MVNLSNLIILFISVKNYFMVISQKAKKYLKADYSYGALQIIL